MSKNISQKTESSIMDQTFATYDDEMTTSGMTNPPISQKEADKKGGASNNKNMAMLVIGVGVIAMLFGGYIILKNNAGSKATKNTPKEKPKSEPVALPADNAQVTPQLGNTPALPTDNNQVTPQLGGMPTLPVDNGQGMPQLGNTPTLPTDNAQVTPQLGGIPTLPVDNGQGMPQLGNTPTLPMPNLPSQMGIGVSNNNNTQNLPTLPEPNVLSKNIPNLPLPLPVEIKKDPIVVSHNNQEASRQIEELRLSFEKQNMEFKSILIDLGNKIEQNNYEQKNWNNSIEERLKKLENNNLKSNNKENIANNKANANTNVNANKMKPKQVKQNKHTEVETSVNNSEIIRNNNVVKKEVVIMDKTIKNVPKESLENFNVHSIHNGRIWIKNEDGSLNTFSIGDKLRTGEVIKKIDEERFIIQTDKRVIQ